MRFAISMLLLLTAALAGPVHASVGAGHDGPAPVETHVPSETAEESETEVTHAEADASVGPMLRPSSAHATDDALGMARETPPPRPPR